MLITVKADSTHQWAGQTIDAPDGVALSMIRRGIATAGAQLDEPPVKKALAKKAAAAK